MGQRDRRSFPSHTQGGYKELHKFDAGPSGNLVVDSSGTIFGASWGIGSRFPGVVFQLDTDGASTVLYDFGFYASPNGGVIADDEGNLYGTTYYGTGGDGTVYELVK